MLDRRYHSRSWVNPVRLPLFCFLLAWGVYASAQQTTVLQFPSWQEDEPIGQWWREAITEFESRHPNVRIEFTKVGRPVFADTLLTQFAGGAPPDIVHLASFEFPQFADLGWLEPLDPWLEQSDILENWTAQDNCLWDGSYQCVMLQYFGQVLVYNDRMFEEAGLEVPTSWEEYIAAARILTQDTTGDGIVDQYGTGYHTTAGTQYLTDMLNHILDAGGNWTNQQGEVIIDTPETTEGIRRWKMLLQENLTPRDLGSGEIRQLLIEGRLAMRIDGPWIYSFIQQASDDVRPHLRIAASPFHPPVGGGSNVIGMPREISDERKQLVWEFIELITSPEWQERYGLIIGQPAPRRGSITEAYYETMPHLDLLIEAIEEAAAAGVDRTPVGLEVEFNEFGKIVFEAMQDMMIRDRDPAEVAGELQRAAVALQARR